MSRVMHLTFASSISDLCAKNSSFDSGVLRVAYTGENRNGSYIDKTVYEKCLETIYNCPIVCHYDRESDSIGSHDIAVVKNEDGGLSIVNVTEPIGVVPESAEPYWEVVKEDDGTEHEYLCVEVLLWKRQEAYKKIKSDGITSESMEITVKSGRIDEDTGFFVIEDFEFTAFCLLGDGVEPCFESASLEVFSNAGFKSQMEQMMCDLKKSFSLDNTQTTQDNSTEGGEDALDEKMKLVEEYGFSVENLDFSIDELSVDELREKFESMKAAGNAVEQPEQSEPEEKPADFALSRQIRDALYNALAAVTTTSNCCWGETRRYWYVDHDEEAGMVYCEDYDDNWSLYGFSYTMDGDNAVVDFNTKKHMKWAIVDFDDGAQVSPVGSVFEMAVQKYTENDAAWQKKYEEATANTEAMTSELNELREFKQNADAAAAKAAQDAVFANFTDLEGEEAFEALKANCSGIDQETLEEKCFAIRGRKGTQANFARTPERAPKIAVEHSDEPEQKPYGGIVERLCTVSG